MCGYSHENEKYYRNHCVLRIPFRGDPQALLPTNSDEGSISWKKLYDSHSIAPQDNMPSFPEEKDGLIPTAIEGNSYQTLAQCAYGFLCQHESSQLGCRPTDLINWVNNSKDYPLTANARKFFDKVIADDCGQHENYADSSITMCHEQNHVLELLAQQIEYYESGERNNCLPTAFIAKQCIVQGRAGEIELFNYLLCIKCLW